MWWIPAQLQSLRVVFAGGGGNTTASDSMWLFGCVQPVLAALRTESATRRRDHRERLVDGRCKLRRAPTASGYCRLVALHGACWAVVSVATRGRRRTTTPDSGNSAGTCNEAEDAAEVFRDRWGDSPETLALRCVADAAYVASREVLGPPVWQDRRGSTRGGDVAGSFDRGLPSWRLRYWH